MKQVLQHGNPKGRVDLLALRLLESAIKARCGAPVESTVSVDLLRAGELLAARIGPRALSAWMALRPGVVRAAYEFGVPTDQTLPQLAESVGLLRRGRALCRRGAACTL